MMRIVEVALASVFAALGVRSLLWWVARSPVPAADAAGHALFALFVTGRAGFWFALSALFTLYAMVPAHGRAFTDEAKGYSWFLAVFLLLGAAQFLAAFFLGRHVPAEEESPPR